MKESIQERIERKCKLAKRTIDRQKTKKDNKRTSHCQEITTYSFNKPTRAAGNGHF